MTNSHSMDFYHAAIKSVDAGAADIRQPQIAGKNARIFFADVGRDTYVYRFTNEYFIRRNHKISHLLALCDVPAPRTTIQCYMKTLFEKYKYRPGTTLRERITTGISDDDIINVYKDVLRAQYQISKIDMNELSDVPNKYYYNIYLKRTLTELPPIVSHASIATIFALSRSGKLHLFHNDLNPGNILVSDDNRASYLLDLDGINVSNTPFSMIRLIQSCPVSQYRELLDFYEELTKQKLPKVQILAMLNFLRTASIARHKFEYIFNISR